MAAVITSPADRHRFLEDPEVFAGHFDLAPGEVHSLLAMEEDLTSLTASFVAKRSMTVRWNAQRTIHMLGERGAVLIDEYVSAHPMVESLSEEAEQFGDFVVARTRDMVDDTFRSVVIAEMARYERLRSRSFWDARSNLEQPRPPRPSDGGDGSRSAEAGPGAVGLTPGVKVGAFGWDMRIFHRCRVFPLRVLREDPCDLVFFHNGRTNGLRVLRLRPDELALVRRLQEGGPLTAEATIGGGFDAVAVGDVAASLLACGAMTWV
jgi:hypothetical protein